MPMIDGVFYLNNSVSTVKFGLRHSISTVAIALLVPFSITECFSRTELNKKRSF